MSKSEKKCILHISGIFQLDFAGSSNVPLEDFQILMTQLGKDCNYRFDMVTVASGDHHLVGPSYPLYCQVTGSANRGDRGQLIERLNRLFTSKGYDVHVKIVND